MPPLHAEGEDVKTRLEPTPVSQLTRRADEYLERSLSSTGAVAGSESSHDRPTPRL